MKTYTQSSEKDFAQHTEPRKFFEVISAKPPLALLIGPIDDRYAAEAFYGDPTAPIVHSKANYSVIEVDAGRLMPQWKATFSTAKSWLRVSGGAILKIGGIKIGDYASSTAFMRGLYNRGAQGIVDQARQMVVDGHTVEEAARWAVNARNLLKTTVRAQGPKFFQALTEARNLRKYGNPVGPNYDQLRQKLVVAGVEAKAVDNALIAGVANTSKEFNALPGKLRFASIFGEVVGFALVSTQDSPASLEPLPKSTEEEVEAEKARIRYGIPASANIDRHGHLKTNYYLQVDLFDPHAGSEIDQESEEILWRLGVDITYHFGGATWTVPGH